MCVSNFGCDVFYTWILTRMDWIGRKIQPWSGNKCPPQLQQRLNCEWRVCWVPHELTGRNHKSQNSPCGATSFQIEKWYWMIDQQSVWGVPISLMLHPLAWCNPISLMFLNHLGDNWWPDTWKHHFQPCSISIIYINVLLTIINL